MAKKKAKKVEDRLAAHATIPERRSGKRVTVELTDDGVLTVRLSAAVQGSEGERMKMDKDGHIAVERVNDKPGEEDDKILFDAKGGTVVEKAVTVHTEDVTEYLKGEPKRLLTRLLKEIIDKAGGIVENTARIHAGLYDARKQGTQDPNIKKLELKGTVGTIGDVNSAKSEE